MAVTADIQQQVFDLLSRASNVSFVSAEPTTGGISALTPGQQVSAEVLSMLPNNRVQVRVGAERFNLDLPIAVRVGQTLEMTFVAADPRSTFAIARTADSAPPVTLSDASRLLSLLTASEQITEPQLRSSLQSIGDILRRSSGEAAVLANLLDEALTYGSGQSGVKASPTGISGNSVNDPTAIGLPTPDQGRLAAFEANAAQILKNIAQHSRFTLIEATNTPHTPLPLLPGEEINATVVGTVPDGRAFVQIAGTNLELALPQKVMPGDILRLTYLAADPKPTFALLRTVHESTPPLLSEAGRWLSVLEHSEGGVSRQQMFVLDRLNTVLKSLPADSPAFSAISDDARTYQRSAQPQLSTMSAAMQNVATSGNGTVLSDDMAKLLQAVIKGNRLALLESLNRQVLPGSFTAGEQIKGEVLAAQGGGRFTVQVAGQILEFVMPKGIRRGDLINLFFITDEPHPTFLMARFGRSEHALVSDTGRWLSGFLGATVERGSAQATLGILRTLLAGPTTDAALLGQVLQQNLGESGLFYESHLSRWFGGDYPLEKILREPQGQLSPRLAREQHLPATPADELARASVRTGSAEIMEAVFKNVGASMAHEGIADQRSLTMVNEQLTSLQNGQLVFRGDLFPGRQLEWTVAEREAGRNRSGERERSWETSVTIRLPHLGQVTAQLVLDNSRVAVKIHAETSEAVAKLEAGKVRLTEQLEGAGLTPAEMSISHAAA